jgi:imidazole glycerol-phosphate synthase subunit HisH
MRTQQAVIVDYGMGNLWSVQSAFKHLGCEPVVSHDPDVVANAQAVVLPGVGSFRKAMQALNDRGLAPAIVHAAKTRGVKTLGICLGMQLFAQTGQEDGESAGLGLIPGVVSRFSAQELGALKVPHIGFNAVHFAQSGRLNAGLGEAADFYFVHSFRLLAANDDAKLGMSDYGVRFMASYEQGNVFATQFHPEKSQTNGLRLLSNFLDA